MKLPFENCAHEEATENANKIATVNGGGFAQSFNFKYLYENHCKSYEML
jgi:hypothetical protein